MEKNAVCMHLKWDIERRGNLLKLMVIGKKITVKSLSDVLFRDAPDTGESDKG
jgi:hypothetical protein